MTPALIVLGAAGFLGRALLASGPSVHLKAVTRGHPPGERPGAPAASWFTRDLSDPDWARGVVEPGDVVLNLVYASQEDEASNLRLIEAALTGARQAGASRFVHCSTAVVVGRSRAPVIREDTPCEPLTPYERTKWKVEGRVLEALDAGLDVAIARPTAILGPGGRNLASLAHSLRTAPFLVNYARACLFASRAMHLVPLSYVVDALLGLAIHPSPLAGEIYHVAADDDPENTFLAVEAHLSEALGLSRRRVPVLPLPRPLLSLALRLRGRPDTARPRHYSSEKLSRLGLLRRESVASAVRTFGASLLPVPRESEPGDGEWA